jgi:hypothetical protein
MALGVPDYIKKGRKIMAQLGYNVSNVDRVTVGQRYVGAYGIFQVVWESGSHVGMINTRTEEHLIFTYQELHTITTQGTWIACG